MVSGFGMSAIVPLRRSAIRRPLPSTGSRRVGSPASAVVRGAPTPCRPSRRTSLPSLGGTALALAGSLLSVTERCHCGPGGLIHQSPSFWFTRGDDRASQVPGEPHLCACPALRPRRDLCARPSRRFGAAFRHYYDVGSHNKPLSGLHHTACALAIYASSPGSPLTTQDSLPAAGQALPGGTGYPLGSHARFPSLLHLILPAQA